jgi:hypothetical protein
MKYTQSERGNRHTSAIPSMNANLKCLAIALVGLASGFFVGRGAKSSKGPVAGPQSANVSIFESDALGFINWFRINGRDEISKDELVRNLRILESKAIASGKLIAFKSSQSDTAIRRREGNDAGKPRQARKTK